MTGIFHQVGAFFHAVFYQPLYNGLVFLIAFLPGNNIGLAIVTLTVIVRTLLLPLTHKSSQTQAKMRLINPHLSKIKEDFKHDKQEQTKRIMELYQKHGLNPLTSCLTFIVQIPVIITLYWVFSRGLAHGINAADLYSFTTHPEHVGTMFFGIDLMQKSIILALFAGITQFFQIKLTVPPPEPVAEDKKGSFQGDFSQSFNSQMKYIFPVLAFYISYKYLALTALYWTTTNLFSILHELYVKRQTTIVLDGSNGSKVS